MGYIHRNLSDVHPIFRDILDKANIERSTNMAANDTKSKRIYHYNLKSSTQEDFDNLIKRNQSKELRVAVHPIRRGLGQLTPVNVLTIKGYYDAKGIRLQSLRSNLYRYAKEMNLHIDTAFSKDKQALLVRLKRNWPVGVDINLVS